MAGETITITELTGSQRRVELRDRALPYRPISFPRETVVREQRYAGNPVKTLQVLGPDIGQLEMHGAWKARYVAEAAVLEGFDDVWSEGDAVTPEVLVAVFDRLQLAANLLEVTFGPEVRRGVLKSFTPTWHRIEDVDWSLSFVWSQRGEMTAPRATPASPFDTDLDSTLSDLEDTAARVPAIILPNVTTALGLAEIAAREAMLSLVTACGTVSGVPEVGLEQFRAVASAAGTVAEACGEIGALTVDASIETLIATDDVASALAAQTWALDMGQAALAMAAAAIRARESVRARVVDDYLGRVTVRRGQTLRSIALEWYGSADDWTTIARANDLVGSIVPPGAQLLIPRRATA
jgi:hypothetical protein